MTINPCCIPLKTGVRMVTHLSMVISLAVGWSSFSLLSISSEVSTSLSTTASSSSTTSGNAKEPPWLSDPHIFQSHQVHQEQDQWRIPYEYMLYYKWHQLQQQLNAAGGGHQVGQQRQQQQPDLSYDEILSPSPAYHHQHRVVGAGSGSFQLHPSLHFDEKHQENAEKLPLRPPFPPPPHFLEEHENYEGDDDDDDHEDQDEQSKIFRSILRHRKNFKQVSPLPRNSEQAREDEFRSKFRKVHDEEREQVPNDLSPLVLDPEERVRDKEVDIMDYHSPSAPAQVSASRQLQQHEMNRMRMRTMMRTNSHRDEEEARFRVSGKNSMTKLMPDFKQQYAKVLLICGLLALCTVVFQFLTSFLLLCFVDKGSSAAAQIWTAVNCSVIFCLATCLVLFLCEGVSIPKYWFDETLYLTLISIDSLLSIYFLWVVMAFI